MQTHPIEIRHPVTHKIIGMLCEARGSVKYVPIELNVVAAMRAYHEAKNMPHDDSEPVWEDAEDSDLPVLALCNINFFKKQAF